MNESTNLYDMILILRSKTVKRCRLIWATLYVLHRKRNNNNIESDCKLSKNSRPTGYRRGRNSEVVVCITINSRRINSLRSSILSCTRNIIR